MSVAGLALDASNRTPIVLLRDPSGRRQVPIWIDHAQAHNIMAGIQGPHQQRLLSHDLMISLLKAGNLLLDRVIIHAIEDSTFQAVLKLRSTDEQITANTTDQISGMDVDARPSDAIALAVRSKCSIWMLEEVVSEASIPVDINADEDDQNQFRQFVEDLSPAALIEHLKERGQDSSDDDPFDSNEPTSKSHE